MTFVLFACFSIAILVTHICYVNYTTNKTLREMSRVANEAIRDIRQQSEALLDSIVMHRNE